MISVKKLTLAVTLIVAMISVPGFADSETDHELKRALGGWVLDSVHAGMHDEELMDAIWNKTAEILGKDGIKVVHIPEEVRHRERVIVVERREKVKKKGGPPPWAPAHGWRKKFDRQHEQDLGVYISRKVQDGVYGHELIDLVHRQIAQVNIGGKIGDVNIGVSVSAGDDHQHHTTIDHGSRGKGKHKGKGNKRK